MNTLIKWFDDAPKWLKVILALPFLDIVWVIYRIGKSLAKNDMIGIVLGIVLLIFGIPFLWLIDIITIVLSDKVLWF